MPQIEIIPPDSDHKPPATGTETVEGGWSFRKAMNAVNTMFAEVYDAITPADEPVGTPV